MPGVTIPRAPNSIPEPPAWSSGISARLLHRSAGHARVLNPATAHRRSQHIGARAAKLCAPPRAIFVGNAGVRGRTAVESPRRLYGVRDPGASYPLWGARKWPGWVGTCGVRSYLL